MGVGTAPNLKGVRANVVGGRTSASGVEALKQMLKRRDYGTVVFDLGTNDPNAGALRQSIHRARRLAPNARIVVPTVHGPKANRKNRLIRHLNGVEVVDWARRSRGLLWSDGIHATPQGYRRRARLIGRHL